MTNFKFLFPEILNNKFSSADIYISRTGYYFLQGSSKQNSFVSDYANSKALIICLKKRNIKCLVI